MGSPISKAINAFHREGIIYVLRVGPRYLIRLLLSVLLYSMPDGWHILFYNTYHIINRFHEFKHLTPMGEIFTVYSSSPPYLTYVPSPKIHLVMPKHKVAMRAKYTRSGFVDVKPGDTVVDVGAFIGGFTLAIHDIAGLVISIEPDRLNAQCLRKNVGDTGHLCIREDILWKEEKTMPFYHGNDPTENSVLPPDLGGTQDVQMRDAKTLDQIANEYNLSSIDFLKLEAEGAEYDILRGVERVPVKKLAIDTSEPSDSCSSKELQEKIVAHLEDRNYTVRKEPGMVFASLAK